jgi:hypothetical protein
MLFRQVHPSWVQDGVPSSQAFRPTKKDEGMLSVARGSMITAEGAFEHHTKVLGHQSAGSWGVTVDEVGNVELACYADPTDDTPHHGLIDFRELARKPIETKSKILLAKARDRGRLHPPEN